VRPAAQVLATVSERDYLSQYAALAGLTGTALSDADVYRDIYHLDVVPIPTNRPMTRVDYPDLLYQSRQSKLAALVDDATRRQAAGQPVLIATVSADDAQVISGLLSDEGVSHELLSATNHKREAEILAEAGQPGAVTVVVKMAGRGVDIVLGGAQGAQYEAVSGAGGLCVLGAERSGNRRMELHLRGRAGRQGDPGESRFYLSADDAVM
jgi:preprotein translocase subunit SecA